MSTIFTCIKESEQNRTSRREQSGKWVDWKPGLDQVLIIPSQAHQFESTNMPEVSSFNL